MTGVAGSAQVLTGLLGCTRCKAWACLCFTVCHGHIPCCLNQTPWWRDAPWEHTCPETSGLRAPELTRALQAGAHHKAPPSPSRQWRLALSWPHGPAFCLVHTPAPSCFSLCQWTSTESHSGPAGPAKLMQVQEAHPLPSPSSSSGRNLMEEGRGALFGELCVIHESTLSCVHMSHVSRVCSWQSCLHGSAVVGLGCRGI